MPAPEKQFQWAELPPSGTGLSGRLAGAPEKLRGKPGKWALVGRFSVSTSTQVKTGRLGFAPAGAFEAVSRGTNNGRADIYARFVGESGEFR